MNAKKTKARKPTQAQTPNTYGGAAVRIKGEPLRVGLIGAGGIAATHFRGYSAAGAQVLGFADPYAPTRERREKEWGIAGFASVEELLEKTSIEAVSVCTPNAFHHQGTVKAAKAGKHVLCEKPLAMDLGQCREMIKVAQKAGVILQTGHHLRSNLYVEKAKELIGAGAVGKVTFIRLRQAHDWGGNKSIAPSFALFKNSGGGTLLDNGCHMMDLARNLGGDVRRVFGAMGTLGNWEGRVEVEDTSLIQLDFSSGAIGSVENAWTATGWEEGFWVYGTLGAIECTNRSGARTLRHVYRGSQGTTWDKVDETHYRFADEGGHPRQVVNFIRAIREGGPVVCTGQDGLEAVKLVLTAYESAKLGKPVKVGR
jgi:predicted dehydrogenase